MCVCVCVCERERERERERETERERDREGEREKGENGYREPEEGQRCFRVGDPDSSTQAEAAAHTTNFETIKRTGT